jgi:lysine-ketoglutarate reductase/saccharopine dehydrogenase-like protein (TIGR00300 family)
MAFSLPDYVAPDFNAPPLCDAPVARFEPVVEPGVAPDGYHGTTIFPEYIHITSGHWVLLEESRMDCVVVLGENRALSVKEFRRLKVGEAVACGRGEHGEEGIFVHSDPFRSSLESGETFAFRTQVSRETSFSFDYDELYELLEHERKEGFILWVLGPAVTFDRDARDAFVQIVRGGFVQAVMAGNALAVHDLEADMLGTALGQEIYTKRHKPLGHYNHLDTVNRIRRAGSILRAVESGVVQGGIMASLIRGRVPYVLAGSIRDDGPLPDVVADVYEAQDKMRHLASRATTVIAMATQLHAIAVGNLMPAYRVMHDDRVRPIYFYSVDMSEFAAKKLADRGSLTARSILTNVQDFIVTLARGLMSRGPR